MTNLPFRTYNDSCDLSLPLAIQIEITERCNCRCPFCYNNSGIAQKDKVPFTKWKELFYRLRELGGVFQYAFSGGEPLLYKKELLELMDIAHEDHAGLMLLTNGYYLDSAFIDKLRRYDWYWIQVSLDSSRADIHDEIRGIKGSYKKAIDALHLLRLAGIPTAISAVINQRNIDDIEGICQIGYELGVDLVMFSPVLAVGRALKNPQLVLKGDMKCKYDVNVRKSIENHKHHLLVKSAQPYEVQIEKIDNVFPYGILIRPNGDVKLDCLSQRIIGNVFDTPIEIIWQKTLEEGGWNK